MENFKPYYLDQVYEELKKNHNREYLFQDNIFQANNKSISTNFELPVEIRWMRPHVIKISNLTRINFLNFKKFRKHVRTLNL